MNAPTHPSNVFRLTFNLHNHGSLSLYIRAQSEFIRPIELYRLVEKIELEVGSLKFAFSINPSVEDGEEVEVWNSW